MQSSERSLGSGRVLGRYEILAPIATGGMAEVWAARLKGSRGFTKTVAVKTLLPGVSDDVRFERMFLDEAGIAARIRHGNVVSILDLGEEQEILYLVMEYVDGESLITLRRAAVDAEGVPLRLALKIVLDAAAGLHAAHQLRGDDGAPLGIVHRDVSPQNILISYDGAVKVTDFGIAKAAGRISQTTERTLKGKPAFMAPEQIEGEDVDARADVFALGIVMYQLISGYHPFRGENDLATVNNILSKRPIQPPSKLNPAVGPELEGIMLRALERDRALRFQSAAELEGAIDDLLSRTRRPRDEELATLMESLLGERGRQRRKELRQAVELADQRAIGDGSGEMIALPLTRISSRPGRPSGVPAAPDTPLASVYPPRSSDAGPASLASKRPLWLLGLLCVVAGTLLGGAVLGVLAIVRSQRASASAPIEIGPSAPTAAPERDVASAAEPVASASATTSVEKPKPHAELRAPRPAAPTPVAPAPELASAAPSAQPSAEPSAAPAAPRTKGPVPVMDPGF